MKQYGDEEGSKIKVAQNVMNHILILEFLKSDEILLVISKQLY